MKKIVINYQFSLLFRRNNNLLENGPNKITKEYHKFKIINIDFIFKISKGLIIFNNILRILH